MATPTLPRELSQNLDKALRPILNPESLLPRGTTDTIRQVVDAANRVLFAPRQHSLGEAITADIYDVVVDIVPFIGDVLAQGTRTGIAKANGDDEAAAIHGLDFVIGAIPVVGDIANIFIPSNTLLYAREASKCVATGRSTLDCLLPPESIDRKLLARMYGRT